MAAWSVSVMAAWSGTLYAVDSAYFEGPFMKKSKKFGSKQFLFTAETNAVLYRCVFNRVVPDV
jgi:hypothetical protein